MPGGFPDLVESVMNETFESLTSIKAIEIEVGCDADYEEIFAPPHSDDLI